MSPELKEVRYRGTSRMERVNYLRHEQSIYFAGHSSTTINLAETVIRTICEAEMLSWRDVAFYDIRTNRGWRLIERGNYEVSLLELEPIQHSEIEGSFRVVAWVVVAEHPTNRQDLPGISPEILASFQELIDSEYISEQTAEERNQLHTEWNWEPEAFDIIAGVINVLQSQLAMVASRASNEHVSLRAQSMELVLRAVGAMADHDPFDHQHHGAGYIRNALNQGVSLFGLEVGHQVQWNQERDIRYRHDFSPDRDKSAVHELNERLSQLMERQLSLHGAVTHETPYRPVDPIMLEYVLRTILRIGRDTAPAASDEHFHPCHGLEASIQSFGMPSLLFQIRSHKKSVWPLCPGILVLFCEHTDDGFFSLELQGDLQKFPQTTLQLKSFFKQEGLAPTIDPAEL